MVLIFFLNIYIILKEINLIGFRRLTNLITKLNKEVNASLQTDEKKIAIEVSC